MATVVAHAAVPLLTRGLVPMPPTLVRRFTLAAVGLACWQDVDYATIPFEVRPTEMLGHGGLTHGLPVAAALALAVGFVAFRTLRGQQFWACVAFLFAAGVSHALLDMLTAGDIGVALFAPLSNARFTSPFQPIASCPDGLDELLGYWGVLTVANEVLYIILPLALAVSMLRPDRRDLLRRWLIIAAAWVAMVAVLRRAMPDEFVATKPRVLEPVGTPRAGRFGDVPTEGLPDDKLVIRLSDLRTLGLFDRTLVAQPAPWSSSFFPTWYGGPAGRWMEPAPVLAWRSLFHGHVPPSAEQVRAWLAGARGGDVDAERALFRLAPLEKVDIALGHLDFPAEKQLLSAGVEARPRPRYWSGSCNGVAAASSRYPEPFRVVDVITKDGARVRFHPNDVKALLAFSYDYTKSEVIIGEVCGFIGFDIAARCSMSPAVLLVAVLNRVGLAKQSLVIDALPTQAKQYYPVAEARAHLRGDPHPMDATPTAPALAGKIIQLVDVDLDLVLSSTTLAYSRENVPGGDATRYRRVGVVPVRVHYEATLALGDGTEIIGGRWTGHPPDGPDDILIAVDGPQLDENGSLHRDDAVPWAFIEKLAAASVDEGAAVPTVDLR